MKFLSLGYRVIILKKHIRMYLKYGSRLFEIPVVHLHGTVMQSSKSLNYFQSFHIAPIALSLCSKTSSFFAAHISSQPPKNSPPIKIRGTLLKITITIKSKAQT